MSQHPKPVEDYINPFLVTSGIVLFTAMWILWLSISYTAALFTALAAFILIDHVPRIFQAQTSPIRHDDQSQQERE